MRMKGLAVIALVLACAQAPVRMSGQFTGSPSTQQNTTPASPSLPAQQPADSTAAKHDSTVSTDYPPPHIVVADPRPPAAVPRSQQETISWAANLVLVLLGYVGIMLAVSTLRKIERQTRTTEAVAEAALAAAQGAKASAQAIIDGERPWILVTPKPSQTAENSFNITATNRGRSPARIVATAERVRFAADESQLPETPDYGDEEASPPMVPVFLLPGESTSLKLFSRAEARAVCATEEDYARVESWEERIFIYGKVVYRDLIASAEQQTHQTDWCCWYIHGRKKSGLVIAGTSEYNKHS
jgi:hypothetical protein